jgi:1,4-alpha-glucan branching enzyme
VNQTVHENVSLLTDDDVYLFKQGTHFRLYEKLGSHTVRAQEEDGVLFAVWAPNAARLSVVGDFNDWQPGTHPLRERIDGTGIWEGFIPGLEQGALYKYRVESRHGSYRANKGDPFARRWELPSGTASVVWRPEHDWQDHEWMAGRGRHNALDAPWSIYELHLGSWRRGEGNRFLSYRELAGPLAEYVGHMGYTHVELMPVTEHPFYGSWGYQTIGYFAPTARYGLPEDLMYLIDHLHRNGIGVLLDVVPSHFPNDEHGLVYFDGTSLYEHADPKRGFHTEWNSYIFNYGRNEVRAFLISCAQFWLDQYHFDGLRVDAVASMLYLDYGRKAGEWIPNTYGGNEDLEAIAFLRELNQATYSACPDVQIIAEESTAWPMVSRPLYVGGLGFGMKWNMGWMHDTLEYFSKDPVYRRFYQEQLCFSVWYAFSENFVLALSHDEVVYGKGSLLGRMPGDDWQKRANLRALYGYMYGHPGKKLLFMGGEFGQWNEWYHERSLDWHLLEQPEHQGLQRWVRDLNTLYRAEPALHASDFCYDGFQWIDCHDAERSVIAFLRHAPEHGDWILVACNFTPVPRHNYMLGVPHTGWWEEILNSDAALYGGSDMGNFAGVDTAPVPAHGHCHSIKLTLPPLAVLFFRHGRAS